MTTRTFQFYGMGYGSETTTITATIDGTVVFDGEVQTSPTVPDPNGPTVVLYTVTGIPVEFAGTKNVSVTVNTGNLILGKILANYSYSENTIYTPEQFLAVTAENMTPEQRAQAISIVTSLAVPPFSSEELSILENPATTEIQRQEVLGAHGLEFLIPTGENGYNGNFSESDSRSNVTIDGVLAPPPVRPEGADGTWTWRIPTGTVFAHDLVIEPGIL